MQPAQGMYESVVHYFHTSKQNIQWACKHLMSIVMDRKTAPGKQSSGGTHVHSFIPGTYLL